jgi:hypothetical protein
VEPVYITRSSVMRAPDIKASAYATAEIDAAMISGARAVDDLCHRIFYPLTATKSFDWPNTQDAGSYRLWLNQHDLISLTALTSGGTTIPVASVLLEPAASGPPYTRMDIDRSSSYAFAYGSGVGQQSLALTGLWGYRNDETSGLATLNGSTGSSSTAITVTGLLDVGHILRIGSERMLVTEKSWVDSGENGTLSSSNSAQTLAVSDGTLFRAGEELLLDAERVLVREVAGNNLIVQRAFGGSTLAAHTTADIYWPRILTVERGALGTTAAAHSDADAIYVHRAPALVQSLNRAYALNTFFQEGSGYARTIGSGEGERQFSQRGIQVLEDQVLAAYGRLRMRTV